MNQTCPIDNPRTFAELADLQDKLRNTLGQAKRLRKYSRVGNFTPVEQIVLNNLIVAERQLRNILARITAETKPADREDIPSLV